MKDLNSYLVWTAVVSPMNTDGSIDYESLAAVLHEQEAAGNAVTILGSTGEGMNLDEAERKAILDFAIDQKLSVPIMAGIGGINLHEQLAWVKHLNTLDLDCYIMLVPLYAKPGIHGQYGWFKALLDAADKPCVLYNIPGRTAKSLEFKTVEMLRDHPRFWAIKEASGSEDDYVRYKAAAPDAHVLSGDDPMLPAFAKLGAPGVVSVAGNAWPAATKEFARQCIAGTFKDYELWDKATAALFCASNPVPVKALLHDLGRIKTPEVRLPLSKDDMADMSIIRDANNRVNEWFAEQIKNS